MKKLTLSGIRLYKKLLSPTLEILFGHACRYSPTCSEYSYTAIEKYGFLKGLVISAKRILRCNPLFKSGYDPVPVKIN